MRQAPQLYGFGNGFGDDSISSIVGDVTGAASNYASSTISSIVTPYLYAIVLFSLVGFGFGVAAFAKVRKLEKRGS